MSSLLLEIGLTNAALALVISMIVVLIVRWRPNAHLEAVLWLVVLVKFVVPPLVPFAVAVRMPATTVAPSESAIPIQVAAAPSSPQMPAEMKPEKPATLPDQHPQNSQAGGRVAALPAVPATASPSPPTIALRPSSFRALKEWAWSMWNVRSGVWLWLGGIVLAIFVLATRAHQFNRIIRGQRAQEPDAELEAAFDHLCQHVQMRRIPRICVVDAEVSPLIWSWFGRTIVLLPRTLMQRLTAEQRSMVLAHELAHLRRHDHSFRWLEALIQSVYWWFPPVRWIRRRLHAAQEQCCDAFVIDNFPERQAEYCDALLAAADWITRARRSPILASEFGRSDTLKHRVQAVLQQRLSRPLTNRSRVVCLVSGLLLVAVSVRWVVADSPKVADGPNAEHKQKAEPARSTTEILVTDPQGRPIATGKVHLEVKTRTGDDFVQSIAIKDGKAVVPLKSPQVDEMTVRIDAPGYLSHTKDYERKNGGPLITVADQYKFQLKPGISIGGKIVDAEGKPVVNARVNAHSYRQAPRETGFDNVDKNVYTNAAGDWEVSGAPPDLRALNLYVARSKDASQGTNFVVSPDEEAAGLKAHKDIRTLPSGPTVSGTVVDPAGKPVRGAMVFMSGRNIYLDYRADNTPKTDAAGSFSITAVDPGDHFLVVFSIDWALKPIEFSVPLKEPLKIVMQKGKRVEFRTVNTQGKPIAGIQFHPQARRDEEFVNDRQRSNYFRVLQFLNRKDLIGNVSDKQGIFRWENAPDEPLDYQIFSSDVLSQPLGEYGPAGSPHTLIFRKRIPVHAKVVDAASGEPIKSYRIIEGTHFKANPPEFWTWDIRQTSTATPEGFDDSLNWPDRLIRYRIQADGYRPSVSEALDAQNLPGEPVSIVFHLQKDAGYSAVVQTPDGRPAADAKVYTVVKGRGRFSNFRVVAGVANPSAAATVTTTDVDGEMRIAPSSDPFLCFISHESGYAEFMDVDLFKHSKISLVPWGKIDGVLMVDGKPAANIKVNLSQSNPLEVFARRAAANCRASATLTTRQPIAKEGTDLIAASRANGRKTSNTMPLLQEPSSGGLLRAGNGSRLTVDIAPGQTLLQRIGEAGTNLRGRILLPKGVDVDWNRSRASLSRVESRTPSGTATRVQLTGRGINDRHDSVALNRDGSFQFFNLEPAEYEVNLQIRASGDESPRSGYSQKITIARKLFIGKAPSNSIDLGDIAMNAQR